MQIDARRAVLFIATLSALLYVNWLYTVARFQPNVMYWDQWEIFVAVTAIGRVSLGTLSGTAPRYLTLMIPMWLAAYLAAARSGRRQVGLAAIACVWALALLPYVSVLRRPLAEWPGTVGLTQSDLASVLHYGTNKAAWVDVYIATGSWEAAQASQRQFLHSNPEGTYLDDKLRFMRQRKVSFFAGEPERGDYMPWLADENFRMLVAGQKKVGAGDGDRTRDIELGKLARKVSPSEFPKLLMTNAWPEETRMKATDDTIRTLSHTPETFAWLDVRSAAARALVSAATIRVRFARDGARATESADARRFAFVRPMSIRG